MGRNEKKQGVGVTMTREEILALWERFKWWFTGPHNPPLSPLPDVTEWDNTNEMEGGRFVRRFTIKPDNWWDFAPKIGDVFPGDPEYVCNERTAERRVTEHQAFLTVHRWHIHGYEVTAYYAKEGDG